MVVESDLGLSTPAVYAEFDRLAGEAPPALDPGATAALLDALRSGDPRWLAKTLANDLAEPAMSLRPDLRRTREDGLAAGAIAALLSGSGPTWLFLCQDALHAQAVRLGLLDRGYEVVPVNPGLAGQTIHGQPVVATLADAAPLDMVDVFRRSEEAGAVADEAVRLGAKSVWMQLGVHDAAAAQRAEAQGVAVVMDACPVIEWRRLSLPAKAAMIS